MRVERVAYWLWVIVSGLLVLGGTVATIVASDVTPIAKTLGSLGLSTAVLGYAIRMNWRRQTREAQDSHKQP